MSDIGGAGEALAGLVGLGAAIGCAAFWIWAWWKGPAMTRQLLAFLALVVASSLYLEARQPHRPDPFVLLVTQTAPAVELFVHRPSGICFVGYGKGGLVIVPRTVCESLPPTIPPVGPPVSPER